MRCRKYCSHGSKNKKNNEKYIDQTGKENSAIIRIANNIVMDQNTIVVR